MAARTAVTGRVDGGKFLQDHDLAASFRCHRPTRSPLKRQDGRSSKIRRFLPSSVALLVLNHRDGFADDGFGICRSRKALIYAPDTILSIFVVFYQRFDQQLSHDSRCHYKRHGPSRESSISLTLAGSSQLQLLNLKFLRWQVLSVSSGGSDDGSSEMGNMYAISTLRLLGIWIA